MDQMFKVGSVPIGDGFPVAVCAELGTNAAGDIDLAKWLIASAASAGCTLVKGQKRCPELAVPRSEWDDLRDSSLGRMSKIDYRRRVEFSAEQHTELARYARGYSMEYFLSVWDPPSVIEARRIGIPALKIPSARLHDRELLTLVSKQGLPTILSTGGATWAEVLDAVKRLRENATTGFSLLVNQCTMAYPARADESNLRVIQTYKDEFGGPVGFSSHKIGIATCVLAVAVGANLVERHVTWSRDAPGSDHRMSSTGEDLKRLVQEIRYAEACLGTGVKGVEQSEMAEAVRLRGSV